MARHGTRRSRPAELVPGTARVISVRMDYLPDGVDDVMALLEAPDTRRLLLVLFVVCCWSSLSSAAGPLPRLLKGKDMLG